MFMNRFNPQKCKNACTMGLSRIKILRNKHHIQLKQLRKQTAELVQNNQLDYARVRVEAVMREKKLLQAYDIAELYLELLKIRSDQLAQAKEMPGDLQEVCSTLVYASSRLTDLRELVQIRQQLQLKFGKEYIMEASNESHCRRHNVNANIIKCLYVDPPTSMAKFECMSEIAQEYQVLWDAQRAYEEMGLATGKEAILVGGDARTSVTPTYNHRFGGDGQQGGGGGGGGGGMLQPSAPPSHGDAASQAGSKASDYGYVAGSKASDYGYVAGGGTRIPQDLAPPPPVASKDEDLPSTPQQYLPRGYYNNDADVAAPPPVPDHYPVVNLDPIDKIQEEPPSKYDPLARAQAAYDAAPGPPTKPQTTNQQPSYPPSQLSDRPISYPPSIPASQPQYPPPVAQQTNQQSTNQASGGDEMDELTKRLEELRKM